MLFYDPGPPLTTHGIGQQRGTEQQYLPRNLILSAKSGPGLETLMNAEQIVPLHGGIADIVDPRRTVGPLPLHLRHAADLIAQRFGVLVPGLELLADLRRDCAFLCVGLDIVDHLDFRLTEGGDQLAGLVRRRLALACRLDELAALLRILAQRYELLHADFRRRDRRRRRRSETVHRGSRRWRAKTTAEQRSHAVLRQRRGGHWRRLCGLVRQRRRERALRAGVPGMNGDEGHGERCNQATDDQGWFS